MRLTRLLWRPGEAPNGAEDGLLSPMAGGVRPEGMVIYQCPTGREGDFMCSGFGRGW